MRPKIIFSALIAASVLYVGSAAADDRRLGTVAADASAPAISKTFSGGSKDRPGLIAIKRLYAPSLALIDFTTVLLDSAVSILGLPIYLATLRLRL